MPVLSKSMLQILTIGLPLSPMNYEHAAVANDAVVDIRASACRRRSMQTISGTRTLTTSCCLLDARSSPLPRLPPVRAPKRPPSNHGVPECCFRHNRCCRACHSSAYMSKMRNIVVQRSAKVDAPGLVNFFFCSCLQLLPQLACCIHATWSIDFSSCRPRNTSAIASVVGIACALRKTNLRTIAPSLSLSSAGCCRHRTEQIAPSPCPSVGMPFDASECNR